MVITESGSSTASFDGGAVQLGAVRGAEVAHAGAGAVPLHLGVASRGAGVVERDVGLAAAADDRAPLQDRVALAGDVEHGRPGDLALDVAGVDLHHAL